MVASQKVKGKAAQEVNGEAAHPNVVVRIIAQADRGLRYHVRVTCYRALGFDSQRLNVAGSSSLEPEHQLGVVTSCKGELTPAEYAPLPWSPIGPSRTMSPSV